MTKDHADARFLSQRFQMVSLLKLARVAEEGVRFLSPHDGSPMYVSYYLFFLICPSGWRIVQSKLFQYLISFPRLLTPEHSISLQNTIGSDIIMQLDDVIATTSPDTARMRESHGTINTLARPLHSSPQETRKPEPLLHHPRRA